MTQYAVIGTAPTVDTSVAVGPFRSLDKAREAEGDLTALGYNTELVPLFQVSELESVASWEEA